jgi:hypothetical protein
MEADRVPSVGPLVLDSSRNESTAGEDKSQPWKLFWRRENNEDRTIWDQSEFPEVSSWTFDPTLALIDRPWRMWTRTTRAETEIEGTSSPAYDLQESGTSLLPDCVAPA